MNFEQATTEYNAALHTYNTIYAESKKIRKQITTWWDTLVHAQALSEAQRKYFEARDKRQFLNNLWC